MLCWALAFRCKRCNTEWVVIRACSKFRIANKTHTVIQLMICPLCSCRDWLCRVDALAGLPCIVHAKVTGQASVFFFLFFIHYSRPWRVPGWAWSPARPGDRPELWSISRCEGLLPPGIGKCRQICSHFIKYYCKSGKRHILWDTDCCAYFSLQNTSLFNQTNPYCCSACPWRIQERKHSPSNCSEVPTYVNLYILYIIRCSHGTSAMVRQKRRRMQCDRNLLWL